MVFDSPVRGHAGDELVVDPGVSLLEPLSERNRGLPAQLPLDYSVVAGAAAHAFRRIEVVGPFELDVRDLLHDVDEPVDRHHLCAS